MFSVGIVMRTKDRAVLLKRALESVLNQTYPHWQLVIVNDGGEPELVNQLIAFYQEKWQGRINIIHNAKSLGMEAASNLGLQTLQTDLAVIHDDDDSWSPDFLLRMTQTYSEQKQQFPNIGGVACHVNRILELVEGNIVRIEKVENWNQWAATGLIPLRFMLHHNQFPSIGFIYELAICKEIDFYDENLPVLGDWDFHIRFMLKKDIWLLAETLAFHHHRPYETGNLCNSTYNLGTDILYLYRTFLENKWLRKDLTHGQFGIGAMVNLISLAMQTK